MDVVQKAVQDIAKIFSKQYEEWILWTLIHNKILPSSKEIEEILKSLEIVYYGGNPFPNHIRHNGKELYPNFNEYETNIKEKGE